MNGYRFDRLKILVVDDNAHMRKLVVTILQAFGAVQIYEADCGERGWALLRDIAPDVVILDWMMEGMSGLEFARRVRTATQTPNPFVPMIMLTGHTHLDHVRMARDAGCERVSRQARIGEGDPDAADRGDRASASLCAHQILFRPLPAPPGP